MAYTPLPTPSVGPDGRVQFLVGDEARAYSVRLKATASSVAGAPATASVSAVSTGGGDVADTGVLNAPAGQASTLFGPGLINSRFQFGAPVFTSGSGSVEIQLNSGAFQSYFAFNAAMAALSDAAIQAGTNTYLVRVNQTNNAAATVEMAII